MSRTLTLVPASVRTPDAARISPRASSGIGSVEAHAAAAEGCLRRDRYRTARRHLLAALRIDPTDARCHYLLGRAFEEDPHGSDRRAARRYRKAVTLNASEPIYRAALGRALVRTASIRSGVNVLRKAADAAPADADVLAIVVEGLREAGEADLAFQLVSRARFLAPEDRAVAGLWTRTKFDCANQRQKTERGDAPNVQKVVPFLRLVEPNADPSAPRTRTDGHSAPAPYAARLRAFRG